MAANASDQDLRDFHFRWASLKPPQRPPPSVCARMRLLLAVRRGPALQLGVTPEIAGASAQGIAVDWNPDMIRLAWPGDTTTHRARLGNWLNLDFAPGSFATAFGDGSLTMLDYPGDYRLLMSEMLRILQPGGQMIIRCFVRPECCETVGELATAVRSGKVDHFGAFKLRLNMATAAIDNRIFVPVANIHAQFESHFADREQLATATGWDAADFAQIDAYRDVGSGLSYATHAQIAAILPPGVRHRFIDTKGYPLAERCPVLVVDFPQ